MRPEGTRKFGRKVSWPVLAALFLVPLLIVGALLGLVDRADEDKVTAAIVNLDEGTEIEGQFVPMGRQLAAEMMDRDGENITWILADEPSADEGLLTGEYSAVVTIPANFSRAAMSFSANDADVAEKARIDVEISRNAPASDGVLAQDIARIATGSLNDMLTSQYLENIYLGFNQVGDQFGQLVDGVDQLRDGADQLADGTSQAADGSAELADGMGQLADGGDQLAAGGDQLADGSYELQDGAVQLADGAGQLDAGVQQMAGQMPALTAGVQQLVDGAEQLLPGVAAYTEGTAQVVGGVGQLYDGLDRVVVGMDSAQPDFSELDQLVDGSAQLAVGADQVADGLDQVVAQVEPLDGLVTDEMVAAAQQLGAQADQLGGFVRDTDAALRGYASGAVPPPAELTVLADQLKAGFECTVDDPALCDELRTVYEQGIDQALGTGFQQGAGAASEFLHSTEPETGMTYLELAQYAGDELSTAMGPVVEGLQGAQQLVPGLRQLRDGSRAVADGNQQLADGIEVLATELPRQLTSELGTLRDGIAQLRDGAGRIVDGAQPLVDNGPALADGSTQLLGGIRQLGSQLGALPAGVSQLADGTRQLSDGARQLSDGVGLFSDGVVSYVDGVWQYTSGVGQAAVGAGELSDGLAQLDDGTGQLADGIGTLSDELAAGADQLPYYSDSDRATLADTVSSPVDQADEPMAKGDVPLAAVILVAGVWLAALAAFVVARPVPTDVVSSRASSLALWTRTVGLPTGIVTAVGLVVGLIGGVLLDLTLGRTVGLMAILALLGVVFSVTQHALAGWLGHIGRGISLVLLAVTVALGFSSAVPGWLDWIAAVSPVHSGMLLTRSWLAGAEVVLAVFALVFVGILFAALSWMAIGTRRQLAPSKFRRAS
ncbi:YhgE/Pip domain-containing protein [Tessaracoccus oleiagri]|uniref:Putative membrane protein n=1 Tax=Tessaracoccus oleiagri TaxID=686624 RepID=A0A1G9HAS1_9ACTN|nr:YhgE/Pip domain-containing protein [Tessaracoccus oleiagri]SDL09573.1 putative membrane protein [Tessaracoccus oleiagri]